MHTTDQTLAWFPHIQQHVKIIETGDWMTGLDPEVFAHNHHVSFIKNDAIPRHILSSYSTEN